MVRFYKPYFYHGLERDVSHVCNYGYFALSVYILVTFIAW